MSYANLGEYLFNNGFTDSQFYNEQFALQSYRFNPSAFPSSKEDAEGFSARYGPDALRAKGWKDGRPHGGNLDLIESYIRHPSNPLRINGNEKYTLGDTEKSDLNYLPGAWKYLSGMAAVFFQNNPPVNEGHSEVSSIETRTEEIRAMAIDLFGSDTRWALTLALRDLFSNPDIWPKLKPFVTAGLKLYRKVMGG